MFRGGGSSFSYRSLAVVLSLLALSILVALVLWDFQLAETLVAEDQLVEWVQALLFAGAGALAARRAVALIRRGRLAGPDLLLTAFFVVLVTGELSLHNLVGIHVLHRRISFDPAVPLVVRGLGAAIGLAWLAAVAAGLGNYKQLVRMARRLPAEPWGHLFLAGVVVFGFTEVFERRVDRLFSLPHTFVEECLELVAAICFLLAMVERGRSVPPEA